MKKPLASIILVLMFVGVTGAEHEDDSIADRIGDDVYRGQCDDDRSPTEMTHATERVANAFGVQVKACRDDGVGNAAADPRYSGVIWYAKSFVDKVKRDNGRDYQHVLELIAAHEIGHLVHFTWGRVRKSQDQPRVEPPPIDNLSPIVLPPVTSCGFLAFNSVACANWYRTNWQAIIDAQNAFLADWRFWFEVEQVEFEYDRRSEMFADCIAGSHLARTAEGQGMVAGTVLDAVIKLGERTPHGTHPTKVDRLTATYHGVAGVHFHVVDIVYWCGVLLGIDTRLD